jgi:hypothetical protein
MVEIAPARQGEAPPEPGLHGRFAQNAGAPVEPRLAWAKFRFLGYLEAIPPGTNRRSHYKTLRKLWRWAFDLGHVEHDPMARLKPLDAWGVNNEVLSVELFQRFLQAT